MNNINNIPPENNKPISNFFNKVKTYFANSLKSITTLFISKKNIKIANKAKDIIPEHRKLVKDTDIKNITNLTHTDIETGHKDDYTLGQGVSGKVQIVAQKKQKISPILIKKQFIGNTDNNIKAILEAKNEHNKNLDVGNDSILDETNAAIINKYKGSSLQELFEAMFNEKKKKTPRKKDESKPLPQKYEPKQLSNEAKASISYQLLEQITNLHQQGILHQDIKPDNILIDAKGKLSIIDLVGASQNFSKQQDYSAKYEKNFYNKFYAPPEIHTGKTRTQYFDCWSVGAIMYELYTGKSLLGSCVQTNQVGEKYFNNILIGDALRAADKELCNNKTIPLEIRKLILQLLSIDANKRPTAEQALASKAFNDTKDIQKMTQIDLNTTHDKHFKNLVTLEAKLEREKKHNRIVAYFKKTEKLKKELLIADLKKAIDDEKTYLLQLQQEITTRNTKKEEQDLLLQQQSQRDE